MLGRITYTGSITSLPVINQPAHRSAALLDLLARRMRLRAESALAPVGLRPRHFVALTVLRDRGGSTQQALATTLQIDRTNLVGLLNELEAEGLIERRRSSEDRRRHIVELTEAAHARLAKAEFVLSAVRTRCSAVSTGISARRSTSCCSRPRATSRSTARPKSTAADRGQPVSAAKASPESSAFGMNPRAPEFSMHAG